MYSLQYLNPTPNFYPAPTVAPVEIQKPTEPRTFYATGGGYNHQCDTRAQAEEWARMRLRKRADPVTIYESVAIMRPKSSPVEVVELVGYKPPKEETKPSICDECETEY